MIAILRQLLAAIVSISIAAPFVTASCTDDPVGNRTQKTSTLPGMPGGLSNYNPSAALRAGANDQLSTDTHDATSGCAKFQSRSASCTWSVLADSPPSTPLLPPARLAV